MIALPSYLLIVLISVVLSSVNIPESAVYFFFLIPMAITLFLSRFFLVFPAVSVDDKELRLKNSFYMTKGNANRLFWGQIVMMLPGIVLLMVLTRVYGVVGTAGYLNKLIFTILFISLSFFDTCLKSSYYAHIYQYFTFYSRKHD